MRNVTHHGTLTALRFVLGVSNPCLQRHVEMDMVLLFHGDDFMVVGKKADLSWMVEEVEEVQKHYQVKVSILGQDKSEKDEVVVLNKIIWRRGLGFELEEDSRHAEVITKTLGLETPSSISALGMEDVKELEGEEEPHRSHSARANYLSADRPELSNKKVCRTMGLPSVADRVRLKRIGRILVRKPRLIMHFP